MRIAMHRLRFDFEIIQTGDGHALLEVFDVTIATLASVGVGLLVEVEVAIIERGFVRSLQLFVLHEVAVEVPLLGLRRWLAQARFDKAIGGLEVLIDEETGGHQRLAYGVHVLGGFLLREVGGEAERIHATTDKKSRACSHTRGWRDGATRCVSRCFPSS